MFHDQELADLRPQIIEVLAGMERLSRRIDLLQRRFESLANAQSQSLAEETATDVTAPDEPHGG